MVGGVHAGRVVGKIESLVQDAKQDIQVCSKKLEQQDAELSRLNKDDIDLKHLEVQEQEKNNNLKLLAAENFGINANYIDFYIPMNIKEEWLAANKAEVHD